MICSLGWHCIYNFRPHEQHPRATRLACVLGLLHARVSGILAAVSDFYTKKKTTCALLHN